MLCVLSSTDGNECWPSNTLRRHIACVGSVSVRFRNDSLRKCENWLSFYFCLSKIPFLGLSKRKCLLPRLATHGSDKSLRVYWRIFLCLLNKSHKFRLISLSSSEASLCCRGEPQRESLGRREVWFDYLRHVSVTKFCCGDKGSVGRDETWALLKTPAWEATSFLFP